MNRINQDSIARIILRTEYSSNEARHIDHYYCGSVNLWRDFFRPDHLELLTGMREGCSRTLIDGETITYDPSWRLKVRSDQWRPPGELSQQPQPRVGRWYPQGFLSGVSGIYPQTLQPMRVISSADNLIEVDCNHPLADIPIIVRAQVESVISPTKAQRGGRCADWLEDALTNGPGIELLREHYPDFHESDRFERLDSTEDGQYYRKPRLVEHLDSQARAHLLACMAGCMSEGNHVLDLMSSVQSHLPEGLSVTGLGMNAEELQANSVLVQWLVHDLNENPVLPFAKESFDVVCCHLSFEYLLNPEQVMREAARVLRPSGQIIVSFSNRWFPEKVTRIWQKLHEFERMSYVVSVLRNAFTDFTTTSFRNWPRPKGDPHYFELQVSDPVYVVTGSKR
ncbi:class I SAM-dependent methyltransferase [Desulfopila aestuarii]|uniref:Ubiquinone/menaquinone biosynthesis C-methylase UbiE n=1 Tax=Desulfopila aestuarii DSM 18488 TaxID=1121416 RepID=A0A1M7Y341_9BACT|nr:class I SAM-dependent methyltransferase [Desulfopila aestuarii]SHO46483.1 Ubiquinone/menaquinone biosynthesis C-methylase UbiE [Desulfopila aestuarii DSM 18488]